MAEIEYSSTEMFMGFIDKFTTNRKFNSEKCFLDARKYRLRSVASFKV